jgi:hypothetical protein
MSIDGVGKIRSTTTAKTGKTSSKGGADFSRLVESETETAASSEISVAQSVASVNSLLALQEVDEVGERRTKARKRATGLLDELDNIRNGLLAGEIPQHQLHLLKNRIAAERPGVDDPKLAALLDEIELRAEVELAKLEEAARDIRG